MRFYGLLFGEAQKADSLFAEVEKNYNELKALVAPLSSAPSVISELKTVRLGMFREGKAPPRGFMRMPGPIMCLPMTSIAVLFP